LSKKLNFIARIMSKIDDEIIDKNTEKRALLMARLSKKRSGNKRWIPIVAAAACVLLICGLVFGLLLGDDRQIPIYRGMTVSNTVPSQSASVGADSVNILESFPVLLDKGGVPNHGNSDQKLQDAVESTLSVVGGAKTIYYAEPNSEVYVTVHIDNPDQFEILSFTLNGQKYSSYMFEPGSDMENLILKVKVGDLAGVAEYTIDAIKYVDGEEIKDVRMEGDRTVRIGVATDRQPTVAVSGESVDFNSVSFAVQFTDELNLITLSGGKRYAMIYDGETVVQSQEIKGAEGTVRFEGLQSGKDYEYVIACFYDNLDGNGADTHIFYRKAFATPSIVMFQSITPNKNGATFTLAWSSDAEQKQLLSLKLVDEAGNTSDLDPAATAVSGLLSGKSYTLIATYANGENVETMQKSFTTVAKIVPTLMLSAPSPTQTSLSFGVALNDPDAIGTITKVELLHGSDAPIDLGIRSSYLIENLLSNNTYTVRVTCTYDLNDGAGVQTTTDTQSVTTVAKTVPTPAYNSLERTQTSFSFELALTDPDAIGTITKVELLHGSDEPIELEVRSSYLIENLLSNNTYTVRVTCTYDLNDGAGVQTTTDTKNITTVAKTAPTLTIGDPERTQTSISFDYAITDPDAIGTITKVELLHGSDEPIELEVRSSYLIENLLSNNTYTVRVTCTYDLNDGAGVQTTTDTKNITTVAKTAPTLTIGDPERTQTSISFDYAVTDPDAICELLSIELLQNGTVVQTLEDLSAPSFTGLESYVKYTVKINYCYDLNDGQGIHSKTLLRDWYTAPTLEMLSFVCRPTHAWHGEEIHFDLQFRNPAGLTPLSVRINGVDYQLGSLVSSERALIAFHVSEELPTGINDFCVESISFQGDGEVWSYEPQTNCDATLYVSAPIEVTELLWVDENGAPLEKKVAVANETFYLLVRAEHLAGWTVTDIGWNIYGMVDTYDYSAEIEEITSSYIKVKLRVFNVDPMGSGHDPCGVMSVSVGSISCENPYVSTVQSITEEVQSPVIVVLEDDTPVPIRTASDLKNMNRYRSYVLMNDIDLTNETELHYGAFRGYFNGNGYTISGYTVVGSFTTPSFGLFRSAEGIVEDLNLSNFLVLATTQNLGCVGGFASSASYLSMKNVTFSGDISVVVAFLDNSDEAGIGGLIGRGTSVTLIDCTCTGTVSLEIRSSTGSVYMEGVGGLIGVADGLTVIGCSSGGTIRATGTEGVAGGLVGAITLMGQNSTAITAIIKDSVNTATVNGVDAAGGLIGDAGYAVYVEHCSNTGAVTGWNAGGLIGISHNGQVTFKDCTNTATVAGSTNEHAGAGGLIGDAGYAVYVEHCSNTGAVTGGLAGGLIGTAYFDTYVTESTNEGTVTGSWCAGGLIGQQDVPDGESVSLKDCRNEGNITVVPDDGNAEYARAGALVGKCNSSNLDRFTISNCTNSGVVSGNNDHYGGL